MTSQFWWYVARSGGVVAWGLSTASVVWGLLLSSRVLGRRVTLPKLLDLHRFLGGLSVVFVGIHMLGLLFDSTVDFGLSALLVPMASKWEPGAVAWGVVAFYLLIAVEITSLLRSSIGENMWRRVHYGGFAVFLFGTIHGLKAGTDVENPLIWWPAAIGSAAVVGLCAYRILAGEEMRIAPRSERVPRALLEKTLSELERFDTEAYPTAAPAQTVAPERIFEPLSEFPLRAAPVAPPRDEIAEQLAASIADRLAQEPAPQAVEPMFPTVAATAPPVVEPAPPVVEPAPFESAPFEPLPEFTRPAPAPASAPQPEPRWEPPVAPPTPSRSAAAETLLARSLPTRSPKRLVATTSAAALGVWSPASRPVHDDAGPPAPPEADPATGEADPEAYRSWLREWLAYVESQP